MCNLYTLEGQLNVWAEAFQKFLGFELLLPAGAHDGTTNLTYKPVMYPKYQGLFVRPVDADQPSGPLEPAVGRWGIVPFFHKGPASTWKFPTNNCRSEEMAGKASFRDAVKSRRCIIPATGFCEYTGPKGSMTKHTITAANGEPLFLAGLWASHTWDGEQTESYSMVMMEAVEGDDMHPFHNRQPIVLDRSAARTWLDLSADYQPILRARAPGSLAFDPAEPVPA